MHDCTTELIVSIFVCQCRFTKMSSKIRSPVFKTFSDIGPAPAPLHAAGVVMEEESDTVK